jgi:hypothetical protein
VRPPSAFPPLLPQVRAQPRLGVSTSTRPLLLAETRSLLLAEQLPPSSPPPAALLHVRVRLLLCSMAEAPGRGLVLGKRPGLEPFLVAPLLVLVLVPRGPISLLLL